MFVESRNDAREFFFQVRRKSLAGAGLEPLEQLVAEIIEQHPEYHPALDDPAATIDADYGDAPGAGNPFLHMGLHIALIEQLQTDRPSGVRVVYQRLLNRHQGIAHDVEHRMMAVLAEELHIAGNEGRAPDTELYLQQLERMSA